MVGGYAKVVLAGAGSLWFVACFEPEPPSGETAGEASASEDATEAGSSGPSTDAATTAEDATTGDASTSEGNGTTATTGEATTAAAESDSAGATTVTSEPGTTTGDGSEGSDAVGDSGSETAPGSESGGCDCGEYEVCFVYFCREAQVVYLNFDAEGDFSYDTAVREDATENVHGIDPALVGALPGYGSGTQRADVLAAVQNAFNQYGVVVTDVRPTEIDYAMIVFTENPGTDPQALGAGQVDCNNAVGNSIYFVYLTEEDPFTADYHANLVTRSIAMGIGLELVTDENDVMSSEVSSTESWFSNECTAIDGTAQCSAQHAQFCDTGDEQLAHMELEAVFGWRGGYY